MVDAWKQLADLHDHYTKEWLVRPDLRVRALGLERHVEFGLGEMSLDRKFELDKMHFKVTERNVGTMRELADALYEACDFVDSANPVWAETHVKADSERAMERALERMLQRQEERKAADPLPQPGEPTVDLLEPEVRSIGRWITGTSSD